ncbi:MAG: VOC family protein [Bacteroidales bacterium]|nr:VOC family protein [Bacteroidales bacterium]
MNIKYHSSVIFTNNLEKSRSFYVDLLGQEIEVEFGKCIVLKCGLTLWQMDENHIIKKSIDKDKLEKGNKFEVCFETDDFEDVYKVLKENGVIFLHQTIEENWGQNTIRIFDPDENIIEIGETLDIFIKRLYNKNNDLQWIHKKTSVPIEIINKIISI